MDPNQDLEPLASFARWHRIPASWLREEVIAGRIPHLRAGSTILLHPPTVMAILAKRAQEKPGPDDGQGGHGG